jgi:predicted nucleic acid-binding protein
MTEEPAFWDASALVPLCVEESNSRQAQLQLRQCLPVVWWASSIEVHSAIARLYRRGKLRDAEKKGVLARLDVLSQAWREILPSDSLRDIARQLLDTCELRAADSLQLAAALTWCQHGPLDALFSPPINGRPSAQQLKVSPLLRFPR